MASIPDIPYEEVHARLGECIHPGRSMVQADLFELIWDDRPAILKDFSARPWAIRRTWGRIFIGREFRALRRLQGLRGIPKLLGRAGPEAIVMERLDARRLPRNKEKPPSPEFFDRIAALVAELHARGIGHGDLRRLNILIDAEEQPYLIDFATAVTAKPGIAGAFSRFVFRRYVAVDRATMARIKSEFHPDRLTDEERDVLAHLPWYLRWGRFLKKNVYRLKKPHHRRKFFKRIGRTFKKDDRSAERQRREDR